MSGLIPIGNIQAAGDITTASLVDEPNSHTQVSIDARISKSAGVASVQSFGAKPDGITECTSAVQAAADYLKNSGGGQLIFPPGQYKMDGMVKLGPDTHVTGYGATILKTGSGAGFKAIAFSALGGSAWTRNIRISGLRFKGNLPSNGVMVLWGHRCAGIVAENLHVEGATTGGHVFDLQGCTDVLIERSVFEGAAPTAGREYVEAIQIDVSNYAGSPYVEANGTETFDGTATARVTVQDCRFLRFGSYAAPRAFGCHSAVENRPYSDLRFSRNYVETPAESTTWNSVINIWYANRVTFEENIFNIFSGRNFPAVINFSSYDQWTPLADVNKPTPGTATAPVSTLGVVKSLSRNVYPAGYTKVARGYDDLALASDFRVYGAGSAALYDSPGGVDLVGAFGAVDTAKTADQLGLTSNNGVVIATIPEPFRPKTDLRFACNGSSAATFQATVTAAGEIKVGRYSVTTHTNPYLPITMHWVQP